MLPFSWDLIQQSWALPQSLWAPQEVSGQTLLAVAINLHDWGTRAATTTGCKPGRKFSTGESRKEGGRRSWWGRAEAWGALWGAPPLASQSVMPSSAHGPRLRAAAFPSVGKMDLLSVRRACSSLRQGVREPGVLVCSGYCGTSSIDSGLNSNLLLTVLEAGKSQIKVPTDSVSGEGLHPGCLLPVSSRGGGCQGGL